ncbi:hypothetical protein BDBG_17779, partial [Blastomyces gilchristii SLH14081]
MKPDTGKKENIYIVIYYPPIETKGKPGLTLGLTISHSFPSDFQFPANNLSFHITLPIRPPCLALAPAAVNRDFYSGTRATSDGLSGSKARESWIKPRQGSLVLERQRGRSSSLLFRPFFSTFFFA